MKFSKKAWDEQIKKEAKESAEFWESDKGKNTLNRNQILDQSPAMRSAKEELGKVVMDSMKYFDEFEENHGKSYSDYCKDFINEGEKECEKILNSMDNFATMEGLIKPFDNDELTGFFVWKFYTSEVMDVTNWKLPERSIYYEFHKYMKEEMMNRNKPKDFTHREFIIAHEFKVKAGLAPVRLAADWKKESGDKAYQLYYTVVDGPKKKKPTKKELKNVIELLIGFPVPQRMAINKLAEIESL